MYPLCVCVRVCVCARACVCACMCLCVRVRVQWDVLHCTVCPCTSLFLSHQALLELEANQEIRANLRELFIMGAKVGGV